MECFVGDINPRSGVHCFTLCMKGTSDYDQKQTLLYDRYQYRKPRSNDREEEDLVSEVHIHNIQHFVFFEIGKKCPLIKMTICFTDGLELQDNSYCKQI